MRWIFVDGIGRAVAALRRLPIIGRACQTGV